MLINLIKAIELIQTEQIVAVPTETVYGLAGDASSESACQLIYNVKQRPLFNPLIIHVPSLEVAKKYGKFNEAALKIAAFFWPGPLTLILPKLKSNITDIATAHLDTIALRVPDHPIIQSILHETQKPLAAPSANVSSRISPTLAEHVNKSFFGKVPVVDGGKTLYGIESTIVDCSTDSPTLLRHGFISEEIISDLIDQKLSERDFSGIINAPGMLKKHYAPTCPIRINAENANHNEIAINFGQSLLLGAKSFNLSPAGNLIEAASNLYALLQRSEDIVRYEKLAGIAVAPIPVQKIGLAINDKLNRASSIEP